MVGCCLMAEHGAPESDVDKGWAARTLLTFNKHVISLLLFFYFLLYIYIYIYIYIFGKVNSRILMGGGPFPRLHPPFFHPMYADVRARYIGGGITHHTGMNRGAGTSKTSST